MKKNSFILSTLIIPGLFFNCNTKEESSRTFDESQVKEEVHQMLGNYLEAIRESGLTAEFDFLDNSDKFFWVPPGFNSAISYDSVKTILEANAGSIGRMDYYWDTLRIIPLSGELANYTGIVKGTIISSSDSIINVNMIETGTVIKRESGWKILNGQSRNLPR